MRRVIEGVVFVGIAVGAHLAVAAVRPPEDSAASQGAGGESSVSVKAASQQVSRMVEDWERPPETQAEPEMETPQAPDMTPPDAPEAPSAESMPTPEAPATAGLALPDQPEPEAEMDTAPPEPPEPPEEPEPEATDEEETADLPPGVRPVQRPDRPEPEPEPEPEPQPQRQQEEPRQGQQNADRQQQRAAGQGGGAQSGAGQQSAGQSLSAGQRQNLTAQWGGQIVRRIERNKRYPRAARGASGTATVRLSVNPNGQLVGLSLTRSTGNRALDQAALQAVRSGRFPAAPRGLTQSSYSFTLSMSFDG
ncbi:outer membrane transport energization protein TonB [Tranquillimonas rosea]|uniref:Outer membrane transport energization protein TonB n=1 Tax=Tranquillimonas rosea TaxID=641238 RepID=A0A1H9WWG1_9RHOB|nr:TonB family protein [Tranquillimonas rosea]SES38268.1 outer membrane transport energization protein TonB [Tranquillimonas rosea]